MKKICDSQITNLNGGDCCSSETVTIPVALLSLLEMQMQTVTNLLPTIEKWAQENDCHRIGHEDDEKGNIAAEIYTLDETLQLWSGSKEYYEKHIDGFTWPIIEHNYHRANNDRRKDKSLEGNHEDTVV